MFEGDYFLLKQTVDKEVGGVGNNDSGAEMEFDPTVMNLNLYMEIYRCLSL